MHLVNVHMPTHNVFLEKSHPIPDKEPRTKDAELLEIQQCTLAGVLTQFTYSCYTCLVFSFGTMTGNSKMNIMNVRFVIIHFCSLGINTHFFLWGYEYRSRIIRLGGMCQLRVSRLRQAVFQCATILQFHNLWL